MLNNENLTQTFIKMLSSFQIPVSGYSGDKQWLKKTQIVVNPYYISKIPGQEC